eukprot:EG_transcript_19826
MQTWTFKRSACPSVASQSEAHLTLSKLSPPTCDACFRGVSLSRWERRVRAMMRAFRLAGLPYVQPPFTRTLCERRDPTTRRLSLGPSKQAFSPHRSTLPPPSQARVHRWMLSRPLINGRSWAPREGLGRGRYAELLHRSPRLAGFSLPPSCVSPFRAFDDFRLCPRPLLQRPCRDF